MNLIQSLPTPSFSLFLGLSITLMAQCLFANPTEAQTVERYLRSESKSIQQGDSLTLQLEIANFGESSQRVKIDREIPITISGKFASQTIFAKLIDTEQNHYKEILPHSSISLGYQTKLPSQVTGVCSIEGADSRLLINVKPNDQQTQPPATNPKNGSNEIDPYRELNQNPHLWIGSESDLVSIHEPTYFDLGASDFLNSKFQISLKLRFFSPDGALSQASPRLSNVFFRYTQTSIWDLESKSAPFIDTSYKPGLFYLHQFDEKFGPLKTMEFGGHHESNGKSGPDSRSTNYVYLKPMFKWTLGQTYLSAGAKIWNYFENDDKTNADISDYWGNLETFLAIGKEGSYQFAATGRIGDGWDKGRIQLEFFYPMHKAGFKNFPMHLHLSYFDGYGETILNYNEDSTSQLRIGFAINQY